MGNGRPKKQDANRKFIQIRIFYEDHQKLAKSNDKETNFAQIIHDLVKRRYNNK